MAEIWKKIYNLLNSDAQINRRQFIALSAATVAASQLPLGCSFGQHKPNLPFDGPMPPLFDQLAKSNPLFAEELLRIPDIRDGISKREEEGIGRLVKSYMSMPEEYDRAFSFIYKVGKPEVRPFNSGVETLFWIYEKGTNIPEAEEIIRNYRKDKEDSVVRMHLNLDLEGLMNLGWNFLDRNRWGDFGKVAERLNAPEPISYYTDKEVRYSSDLGRKSIMALFKSGMGNCYEESVFIKYLLVKGGYDAELLLTDGTKLMNHIIVGFKDGKDHYIIDNGRPMESGIIGPWESYEASHYKIYPIHLRPKKD